MSCSQFSDIYQEGAFMTTLKGDIDIVRELPSHLKSIDFQAIGSLVCIFDASVLLIWKTIVFNLQSPLQVTDADLSKEATPSEYIRNVLPILLHNGVVHFLGFGNRLGFDPLPSELQVKM